MIPQQPTHPVPPTKPAQHTPGAVWHSLRAQWPTGARAFTPSVTYPGLSEVHAWRDRRVGACTQTGTKWINHRYSEGFCSIAVAALPRITDIPVSSVPCARGHRAFPALHPTTAHREPHQSVLVRVRMLLVVLPEQILPIIVPVRRPNHRMDVLAGRLPTFQMPQRDRGLMIKLD